MPEDFEVAGDEETLTIEVTYDTRKLYGTVTGSRDIIVEAGGDS